MATSFQWAINASMGFCELGMWQEAWDELEGLESEQRSASEVVHLRLAIFIGLKQWESAAVLAESMLTMGMRRPSVYLQGAYAIRRCRSLTEARTYLLAGEDVLQADASFHFNLACYECQLGDLAAAKRRLEQAYRLDPAIRATAIEDEDLAPLWASLWEVWP